MPRVASGAVPRYAATKRCPGMSGVHTKQLKRRMPKQRLSTVRNTGLRENNNRSARQLAVVTAAHYRFTPLMAGYNAHRSSRGELGHRPAETVVSW